MNIRPALLLLALVLSASAAEPPLRDEIWIDISGPWKTTGEDSPRFAAPDFDDSQWATTQLPGIDLSRRGRTFWLRRTLVLPPGTDRSHLALTLGKVSENYTLFVNGALVATVGDLTRANAQLARPRTFDLPPLPDGPVHIAVRAVVIVLGGSSVWTRFPDSGPYLLTGQHNAAREAGLNWLARLRALRTPDAIVAVASLALGLILLLMYVGERSRTEVLWLALYGILMCWRRGLIFFQIEAGATPWRWEFDMTNFLLSALLVMASARLLRVRWKWLPWFVGAVVALFAAHHLQVGGIDRTDRYGTWLLDASVAAVIVAGLLDRRNSRVLAGSLAVLLFTKFLTEGVTWVGWIERRLNINTPTWNSPVHPVYTVVFLLAMVLLLTRRALADQTEKLRLANEIEAARTVQQLLIPPTSSVGVDAVYLPAAEVGGDFWHFFDDRLLIVGDVSGKGLKAAMLVSLITGLLDQRRSDSPAALLSELNAALRRRLDGGFVTCCIARVDGGSVTLANAGHPAPYLDGRELELSPGLPLGIVPDAEYTETSLPFAGQLTLVSDGVIEAANASGELFGFDRTRAISTQTAQEIASAAKQWGQNDDITVVTVRRPHT